MSGLLETLQSGGHILGDGAMGTMLQDAGLTDGGAARGRVSDDPVERWSTEARRG